MGAVSFAATGGVAFGAAGGGATVGGTTAGLTFCLPGLVTAAAAKAGRALTFLARFCFWIARVFRRCGFDLGFGERTGRGFTTGGRPAVFAGVGAGFFCGSKDAFTCFGFGVATTFLGADGRGAGTRLAGLALLFAGIWVARRMSLAFGATGRAEGAAVFFDLGAEVFLVEKTALGTAALCRVRARCLPAGFPGGAFLETRFRLGFIRMPRQGAGTAESA